MVVRERLELDNPFIDILEPFRGNRSKNPPEGSNRTESEISGVGMNGDGDSQAMISSIIFSSVGGLVLMSLFAGLRRFHPAVYARGAPASQAPASWGACAWLYVDWLWLVLTASRDDEVEAAGLDGWVLLEFYRLMGRILAIMGPVLVLVLGPVHLYVNKESTLTDFVSRLDIANLPDGSWAWWLHAAFVWFVVIVTTCCIRSAHNDFLARRFKWLQEVPMPQSRTIMVENIPADYRSDRALKGYFERVFQDSVVERAYLVRRTGDLVAKVARMEALSCKIMIAEQSREQAGGAEGVAVAKRLELLCGQRAALRESILKRRARIEEACSGEAEGGEWFSDFRSASGFVTFKTKLTARLASRENYRIDVTECAVSEAPDPRDVLYDTLAQEASHSKHLENVGWLCLVGLFIFWSPIVVFISSWTTLSTIQEFVPFLKRWCTESPALNSFLEGVLASAALKLFLAYLPNLLLGIIHQFFELKAGAYAQFRLERWYFSFLAIFVLLVTILGRSIIITAVVLVQQPGHIIDLLAASLPSASHFYFNYIILGWFTLAFETIRVSNLCKYLFYKYTHQLPNEVAKEWAEPEDPGSFGMGPRMALAMLFAAITFVFCACSPLIVVPAWIYFCIGRTTYGYLLVYCEVKKPDLGGHFWVEAVKQLFFALILYVLLMTGVLASHCGRKSVWEQFGPPVAAFLAMVVIFLQYRRVLQLSWECLPLEVLVETTAGSSGPVGEYVQPELVADVGKD